jgi:hypothetical protein
LSSLKVEQDTGEADPGLLNLLISKHEGFEKELFNKLTSARLIGGLVAKKEEHVEMMQVNFVSNDGRLGMPVFTSVGELNKWNIEARPLPLSAKDFAQQTISQKLDGLIIDLSSSHRFVISGYMLDCLANERSWDFPHEDQQVKKVITSICQTNPKVGKVDIEKGTKCDLTITIHGPASLAIEVIKLANLISEHPVIREKVPRGADLFLKPSL